MKKISLIILIGMLGFSCQNHKNNAISPQEAKSIAKDAFVFGFPIVMNYKTMYAYTLNKNSSEFKGDFNELGCEARVYTPEDKAIVTPNSDTPYCMGWADISSEPVVISVPDTEPDRFYHIQLIDMLTHNFAYIGTLTTGNESGKFMVAHQDWDGTVPEGIKEVIRSETEYFFMIVRTQLFNPSDLERIQEMQSEYDVQTFSEFNGNPSKEITKLDIPAWNEGDQFSAALFTYLDPWLSILKPSPADEAAYKRFSKIGLGTGQFDINTFDPELKEAIEEGAKEGMEEIVAFLKNAGSDPLGSSKIFGTRSFLEESAGENFNLERPDLLRAVGAQAGLYGNSGSEAVYPTYFVDADGNSLDASTNKYTIKIKADSYPPVKAFWSLTMYDGKTQLLVENELDRYLLNSTMADDFHYEEDGSLILYIQNQSPGLELESNWLPAPDGPFYATLRLYGPENEVLDGTWSPPQMQKVE